VTGDKQLEVEADQDVVTSTLTYVTPSVWNVIGLPDMNSFIASCEMLLFVLDVVRCRPHDTAQIIVSKS